MKPPKEVSQAIAFLALYSEVRLCQWQDRIEDQPINIDELYEADIREAKAMADAIKNDIKIVRDWLTEVEANEDITS